MRIRTGYSFRTAVGHLPDAMARLKEVNYPCAPITDRLSTFGFNRWTKLSEAVGLKPVYGVELACVVVLGEKKPTIDYWTFLAIDSLRPLHELIWQATNSPVKEPSLIYSQAVDANGLVKIAGSRLLIDKLPVNVGENFYIALSPSTPKGLAKRAKDRGLQFIACCDNFYPRKEDEEFYRITLGSFRASTQTYPQYILNDQEWLAAVEDIVPEIEAVRALQNRKVVVELCNAKMKNAKLLVPEKLQTLRALCLAGAARKGCDLTVPVYAERLDRELALIEEKQFEDYFYILSDIIGWAKLRMVVGPARGSSCGSLVCYLLDITAIDPIPYGLIFERFIDVNRTDLPDIDVDFSDTKRSLVFDYVEERYGREHAARLGTVGMFKPRSALKQAGGALRVPAWRTDKILDSIVERSSGDSRAMNALEDTMNGTDAGKKLLQEHPELLIATRMEGHPNNASQHAAGMIITDEPVIEYVALDARTKAVWCDKKDSEDLNLLKIDALGLTQLSVFERCLELIGEKPTSAAGFLERLPLDDPAAFEVLNQQHFSGIFQFTGTAMRSIAGQIHYSALQDIVATTAITRPGPLATGGAHAWIRRKRGAEAITTAHPMLTKLTEETYGVIIYQEQVMRVVREMGNMSWEDTSAIRKAMSGRLGDEFFEKYWLKFQVGALENGVDAATAKAIWSQINTFGAWAFNQCIVGSTRIRLANAGSNLIKDPTISELYEIYERNPSDWIKQQKSKPHLVSLFPDGRGFPQMATRIIKSGLQDCYRYYFSDGSTVECTKDHKFIINGKWSAISEAIIGDEFTSLIHDHSPALEGSGPGKGHAKGKRYGDGPQAGFPSGDNNPSWVNGLSNKLQEFKDCKKETECEDCGKKERRMEVHHNDFRRGTIHPDDLSWLCVSCHKKRHYAVGRTRRWQRGMVTAIKKLVKRKSIGRKQTYDIEMPTHHNFTLANGLVTHNSHAVAYGIMSYYCCWLKAHHPVEFAAATLDAEVDPAKQIAILRELAAEGVEYVAVDPKHSTNRWTPVTKDGKTHLVGPLTAIKGIGPVKLRKILDARSSGQPLQASLVKQLENARTELDSLFPVADRIKKLHPDLTKINIFSEPSPVVSVQTGVMGEVMIFAVVRKIAPRNENEAVNVMKRDGRILKGPTQSLNLFFADDTDEIFAKVDRFNFERLGRKIVEEGRAGKSLYAIKGTVPSSFRMIQIKAIRYLGEMDISHKPEKGGENQSFKPAGDQ